MRQDRPTNRSRRDGMKESLRRPSKALVETLAENVRTLRQSMNLSQEELADKCDLHRTYVGSVERAERNVTLSTLEVLSAGLGVCVPELLTRRDSGGENDGDESA